MKRYLLGFILLQIASVLLLPKAQADFFMYNGKIFSLGANKMEVVRCCGEPTYIYNRREEKLIKKYDKYDTSLHKNIPKKNKPGQKKSLVKETANEIGNNEFDLMKDDHLIEEYKEIVDICEWTYNFGPKRFIQTFIFENNNLVYIKTGGYGYTENITAKPNWDGFIIDIGSTMAEVLMKIGEPALKDKRTSEQAITSRLNEQQRIIQKHKIEITTEEWTYNLGPNRFIRILTFQNNRLLSIKTGDYGYEIKEGL